MRARKKLLVDGGMSELRDRPAQLAEQASEMEHPCVPPRPIQESGAPPLACAAGWALDVHRVYQCLRNRRGKLTTVVGPEPPAERDGAPRARAHEDKMKDATI